MNPELEKLLRKITIADIKIEIINAELKGLPINKEEIMLILEKVNNK